MFVLNKCADNLVRSLRLSSKPPCLWLSFIPNNLAVFGKTKQKKKAFHKVLFNKTFSSCEKGFFTNLLWNEDVGQDHRERLQCPLVSQVGHLCHINCSLLQHKIRKKSPASGKCMLPSVVLCYQRLKACVGCGYSTAGLILQRTIGEEIRPCTPSG